MADESEVDRARQDVIEAARALVSLAPWERREQAEDELRRALAALDRVE